MFDSNFQHYLSYGATDQRTVTALQGAFDGLLVPGTVATFQFDGTGGFVLSLSASRSAIPYVIDPRFPLFQQPLPNPKKSHEALAAIFSAPELIRSDSPTPAHFTQTKVAAIAEGWCQFNSGYQTAAASKLDKYAERLGEPIEPELTQTPALILSPYTIAHGTNDEWWHVSERLHEATVEACNTPARVVRVVATDQADALDGLLQGVDEERVVVWVSNLSELDKSSNELAYYGQAIADATRRGQSTFGLYGGFFAVLLENVGLGGASHGIGYGEYRNWIELPQSGPPPARYYLPLLHRYVSQELAYQLWSRDRALAECLCDACEGNAPIALDYRALMDHSVLMRQRETVEWTGLGLSTARERLESELDEYRTALTAMDLPVGLNTTAWNGSDHLPRWIEALAALEDV